MELVRYDAMVNAIAVCERIDEVKDIRDKALALEAYAKQANNLEAERQCALIRVRAERKCGQMLRDTEKAKGTVLDGKNSDGSVRASNQSRAEVKTLSDMGITYDQSSTWQKLAEVSEKEFEEAITLPGTKPSARHIIKPKDETEPKRMDKDALYLWGVLREFRNRGLFDIALTFIVSEWTQAMQDDALSIIPKLKTWVNDYE